MAIVFHCEHCGKKIDAPPTAGGKWGKCPSCHSRIYIPLPEPAAHDAIRLAPLDETDEEKRHRLLAETFNLNQEILQEKAMPDTSEEPPAADDSLVIPMSRMDDKELAKEIVRYLRLIADGDLDKAAELAAIISAYGRQTLAILDHIALSEIPEPELANIPSHVLSGLIRNLRSQL